MPLSANAPFSYATEDGPQGNAKFKFYYENPTEIVSDTKREYFQVSVLP